MIKRMVILLYDGERLWCFDGLMDLDGPRYLEAFSITKRRTGLKAALGWRFSRRIMGMEGRYAGQGTHKRRKYKGGSL